MDDEKLEETATVSVPEAGRILANLCRDASYAAANRGEIPVMRFGRKKRVSRAWIRRTLEQGGVKQS